MLSERAQEHVYGSSLGRPSWVFGPDEPVSHLTSSHYPPPPKLAARSVRRVGFALSRVQARLLMKPILAGPHQQDPSWAVLSRLMLATPAQGQVLQSGVTRETVQRGVLWLLASFAYPDVPCSVQPQGGDTAPCERSPGPKGAGTLCCTFPIQGRQMYCSSSLSFRSRDHLSPASSTAGLCRDSLSDVKEDRDTWLT